MGIIPHVICNGIHINNDNPYPHNGICQHHMSMEYIKQTTVKNHLKSINITIILIGGFNPPEKY